jgi:GT2 family glycosyltransferase
MFTRCNTALKTLKMLKQKPALMLLNLCACKLFGFKTTFYLFKNKIQHYSYSADRKYEFRPDSSLKKLLQDLKELSPKPLITIVMLAHTWNKEQIERSISAIAKQIYPWWELKVTMVEHSSCQEVQTWVKKTGEKRMSLQVLQNGVELFEAVNRTIGNAQGELICILNEHDELTADALYNAVKIFNQTAAEIVYSDHDHIDKKNTYCDPQFKPDFSPDLLLGYNYIGNTVFLQKNLFMRTGGFRSELAPCHVYDLILRTTEKTDKIAHIPKVLYHRKTGGLHASAEAQPYGDDILEQGKKVIESALERCGIGGCVCGGTFPATYRVKRSLTKTPLVSIIIPFKDKPEYLEVCINSILQKSTYDCFEIIGVNNQSREEKTQHIIDYYKRHDHRIHFIEYPFQFNYAKIHNYAVNGAKGEQIIFLNNDIEIITPEWIEMLLEQSQRPEIGAVGAKLYYKDNTIQHAGVIIGLKGIAGHIYRFYKNTNKEFLYRVHLIHNLSAVTGALLMCKKEAYLSINGMDEEHFPVSLNDIDLCLRLLEKGFLNVMTPYCEAYHEEAVSRGLDETFGKVLRFYREAAFFKKRHAWILKNGDPYYNKNLPLFQNGLY